MPLYLLPNTFEDDQPINLLLPIGLKEIVLSLDGLIAESERAGRRYLLKVTEKDPKARETPIFLLNEHTKDVSEPVGRIVRGETIGLISDAGMPGIADPGAEVVSALRERGMHDIRAISGPSAIFLALILSGLGGQRFCFQGYLPKDPSSRKKLLCQLERDSKQSKMTQICIEAPYRNKAFFADCISVFSSTTQLAIAQRLTLPGERVEVKTIGEWRRCKVSFTKDPMTFVFRA